MPDSVVITDGLRVYDTPDAEGFRHERASATTAGRRPSVARTDGRVAHVNGIENFWSQAKRHLRRYNGIPKAHFELFLKECEWRVNYYGIAVSGSKDVKVYNNLVYDNTKAGLAPDKAKSFEAFGNVLFGNDLAQIHVRNGDEVAFGFNTIIATEKQGPPIRNREQNFASLDAYREKYGYQVEANEVVKPEAGTSPVEMAKKLHKEKPVTAEAWQPVHQRLVEMAAKAGVGAPPATVPQAPYDPSASLQAPLPWRLPRVVEFEHYDVGGPGVSFSDTDEENQGKHYRKDAVDVKASSKAGNGAVVGFTQAGEWMEYTVSVADAGSYALSVMYATPDPGRRIQLSLGGDKPLVSPIQFAPTAGWDDLKTMQAGTVTLPAGDSVIRVTVESGPVDLDYMEFKAAN